MSAFFTNSKRYWKTGSVIAFFCLLTKQKLNKSQSTHLMTCPMLTEQVSLQRVQPEACIIGSAHAGGVHCRRV